MSKLKQALQLHGVDAAHLETLFGSGKEAVQGLITDGVSAVEIWRRLRAAAGEIGYWPLILGTEQDVEQHAESFRLFSDDAPSLSVTCIIAAASKVNSAEWLTARAAAGERPPLPITGDWPPSDLARHTFKLPVDCEHGKPLPRVYIGLVPTVIGWQVPAFLRFGGWNNCPSPEYHVAMLKRWRHAYGAEIVGMGASVLEIAVSHPPLDRNAALRLAREHCVYCPDEAHPRRCSLETRAAILLNATAWSFWWE